ncbi:MAG: hypothetical protein MJ085_05725 [Clostridia bacterium]|nr:hypothetical protein [Clostridia bacterium]
MDCPIEISVYENDRTAGELQVRREGLYYVFSCRLALQASRILRLYVIYGFRVVPIGVLMPGADGLTLEHRISVHTWPLEKIATALCGYSPEAGWLPWRGAIGDTSVCGWIRERENGYLLAVDVSGAPFPLIENISDAEPLTLSGIDCMCLSLTPEGEIVSRAGQKSPAHAQRQPAEQGETGEL